MIIALVHGFGAINISKPKMFFLPVFYVLQIVVVIAM